MDDNFREKLLEAMKWENSVLRRYTDKSRLDQWFVSVVETAEKACQAQLDALTAEGAAGVNGAATSVVNGNGHAMGEVTDGSRIQSAIPRV